MMKRLVEEVSGEGLESLIGKRVTIWCLNYIYAGKLVGVNESDIKLADPQIVYETGDFKGPYANSQNLQAEHWYIRTSCIESYGVYPHHVTQ